MSQVTSIGWTDSTFNAWEGCTAVSPGCANCYAERRNRRFGGGTATNWGPGAPRRRTAASTWAAPKRWNRGHAKFFALHGRRRCVFCSSLSDVFDNEVPAEWRRDLADLIIATPNLDWQLLTKRIGNADAMLADMFPLGIPENVWIGATVVDQAEADRDIPKLLTIRASVRFLSIEPMLGHINLRRHLAWPNHYGLELPQLDRHRVGIDWVIAGGESGLLARSVHPGWIRSLRDQCAAAGIPFFFKQWGEWRPAPEIISAAGSMFHCFADGVWMQRVGARDAGNLLDGIRHEAFPIRRPSSPSSASTRSTAVHAFVFGDVGAGKTVLLTDILQGNPDADDSPSSTFSSGERP
ncbi:phage Gp37/Gp68 family protein [Burkholderia glumae]|uniref:phage Gp37/Gp68 family protein n=1 Tax=Burkholderia glumae TaxID=337 RepID=UPI0032DF4713